MFNVELFYVLYLANVAILLYSTFGIEASYSRRISSCVLGGCWLQFCTSLLIRGEYFFAGDGRVVIFGGT